MIIEYRLVLSECHGCIQRYDVPSWVWRWIFSFDGIQPRSQVASISVLLCFAHLAGLGCDGLHDFFSLHVNCIFGFSNATFLGGLGWRQAVFPTIS